jgi:cation transport protein ChaC
MSGFVFVHQAVAERISRAVGPSGPNIDYLFNLTSALRELVVDDPHVFDLEARVRALRAAAGH